MVMEKQEQEPKKKGRWKSLKRWKRTLIITGIVLVTLVALIFTFLSTIAQYLIEKYDVKYTGREIKMDWMFVNVFTGYVHFENLTIYEQESDSVFFNTKGLSVDLSMHDLFSKTYTIQSVTLNKPWARIIQDGQQFNFTDLIEKFSPDSTEVPDTTKPPLKLNVLNVEINNGEFHYIETHVPVNYFVKEVNIATPGYRWDHDLVEATFSLKNGPGSGDVKGNGNFNLSSMDYMAAVTIDSFDLKLIEQYIKDLTNYGTFRAFLDLDMKIQGNTQDSTNMMATGFVKVNDVHFGKTPTDDYVSLEQVHLQMREISPKHYKYIFDSVIVKKPYFKYERYDDGLDNIQTMFGRKGSNVKEARAAHDSGQEFNLLFEIADFIDVIAKNFLKSYYRAGRIAVYDADIHFNDYTLTEKFGLVAKPLTIEADSIDKYKKWMNVSLKTNVTPSGHIYVGASINPQNFNDFNIHFIVNKVPVAMFNPYLLTYTSFPADRGTIELKGDWYVKGGTINSKNNLLLLDPRFASRLKNEGFKWIPMRFILSILRSRGNVIDYDIPITGSLKDPSFNVWDVVGDILTNIFVKPPSLGYILKTRTIEKELEKSLTLKWETRSNELKPVNKRFMDKVGDFLVENPAASVTVTPMMYTEKEKEAILFFEAKKKYYMITNKLKAITSADSVKIAKMSIRDATFAEYLKKHATDSLTFTVQDKCRKLVGVDVLNAQYQALLTAREKNFRSYFEAKGVNGRVKVVAPTTTIPFNGFSYYKIDYKGELPEKLLDAYYEMNDLNKTKPRKKYEKKRENLGLPVMEVKETKEKKKRK